MRMRFPAPARLSPALAVALSALLALIAMALLEPAGAQSSPGLYFEVNGDEGCVSVDEGDEVEVTLQISGAQDLQSWEATITYDRDILEITQHNTRLFLAEETGSNLFDASEPLPDVNGRHFLSVGDLSTASESGAGVLGAITFRAIEPGVSVIDIPQVDRNGDGRTDEGGALTSYGNVEISDVNGDAFFDGPVHSALVAVEANCSQATPKPTDPPTPAPGFTSGAPGASGAGASTDPSAPVTGGASPGSEDGSPAPTGDPANSPPATGTGSTNDPANTGTGDGDVDSSSAWVVVALSIAGFAVAGGLVLMIRLRKPGGSLF